MTYAWVAVGSALGGMARYWMAGAMATLTGVAFPWGTILINILGSFVIGFFGMLTGVDGRLGVAPDVRVFVMTGLCGGFTTFSAFSLQTLELARDGRALAAAGNVALSVALCLAAVTLGAWAAGAFNSLGVRAR
jgi:CrcB protein